MSKQYPAQFGGSPQYRNPDVTLPMPAGRNIPVPQWYSTDQGVTWGTATRLDGGNVGAEGVLPTGFQYTATFGTPDFDLRPDLRSGQAGPIAGIPIWSRSARLFLTVRAAGGVALSLPNLTATVSEFTSDTFNQAATNRPSIITPNTLVSVPLSAVRDVSGQFNPSVGANAVVAGFSPPGTGLGGGEGHPIRYWRISFSFTIIVESEIPLPAAALAPPSLSINSAVY